MLDEGRLLGHEQRIAFEELLAKNRQPPSSGLLDEVLKFIALGALGDRYEGRSG